MVGSQKINLIRAISKQASCAKSDAEMVLASLLCWCDSAVGFLDSARKFKPTSTTLMPGAAKRRAECTSLGPRLKHASLTLTTPVWPRKDVPRRFT